VVEEVWVLAHVEGHCVCAGEDGDWNTKKIVDRLVLLGVIKKVDGTGRTIRPAWVNYKNLKELE
jgi:hypothetical protein